MTGVSRLRSWCLTRTRTPELPAARASPGPSPHPRPLAHMFQGDFLKEADADVGKIAAVLDATPASMRASLQEVRPNAHAVCPMPSAQCRPHAVCPMPHASSDSTRTLTLTLSLSLTPSSTRTGSRARRATLG